MKRSHTSLLAVSILTAFSLAPFAKAGVQIDDSFSANVAGTVHAIGVAPDGTILLGGEFDQVNGTAARNLGRLNANGSLIPGFETFPDGAVLSIQGAPDGSFVIGGAFNSPSRHLLRLTPSGALDTTLNVGSSTSSRIDCLAFSPDGSTLFGGPFRRLNGEAALYAGKISVSGSLDGTFASALTQSFSMEAGADCIAVQADGKVIVGGNFNIADSFSTLARLNSNGSLDSTFSANSGPILYAKAIVILPDGRLLVGGTATSAGDGFVRRLNSDGSVDSSFQEAAFAGSVESITTEADGSILVGGNFEGNLARLLSDGSLDPEWNIAANGSVRTIALQADGSILVGGAFSVIADVEQSGIARLVRKSGGQSAFATNSNGRFAARIAGETGRTYEIEASADLQNWSRVGTSVASAAGIDIEDAAASSRKHRFFRAKLVR